jgi:hypothetical protein
MKSLLKSRKVLLAVLGVIQTAGSIYLDLPAELWVSINALLVTLIGAIAVEDAADKRAGTHISQKQ